MSFRERRGSYYSRFASLSRLHKWIIFMGLLLFLILIIRTLSSYEFRPREVAIQYENIFDLEENESEFVKLKYNYGIMGDLGSSGSRVYVYRWIMNKEPNIACSIGRNGRFENFSLIPGWEEFVGESERNEQKPGISSVAKPPFDVSANLNKILKFALNLIPEEKHSSTPIYFFATAGLRVLAEDNGERIYDDDDEDLDYMLERDDDDYGVGNVSKVLIAIKDYVHQNFPFIIRDGHVKILTGKEEAAFEWIALQHMLRSGGKMMAKEVSIPINAGELVNGVYDFGSIDMGGASAQIAFQTQSFDDHNFLLKQGFFSDQTKDIPLFAQSYLGYGMYESRGTLENHLAVDQLERKVKNLENPCFLFNNTQHVMVDRSKHPMKGTGNFDQCWDEILKILDFSYCDEVGDCHLAGVVLPERHSPSTRFIAIDNAYRAAKFFDHVGYTDIHQLELDVRNFCAMEYNDAVSKYTPLVSEFRIKRYCYEGVYLVMILQLGFKFPYNFPIVGFSDYIQGVHLNWGLGAFAYQLHTSCTAGLI